MEYGIQKEQNKIIVQAVENNQCIWFCIWKVEWNSLLLSWMLVNNHFQRQWIGTKLRELLECEAKHLWCTEITGKIERWNTKSIAFHEKLWFTQEGIQDWMILIAKDI